MKIKKKLTLVQKKRLLRVARALRESPAPKRFTMSCYVHGDEWDQNVVKDWCGTPACALGHFASRRDLQKLIKIDVEDKINPTVVFVDTEATAYFDHDRIMNYFGLDNDQVDELFGPSGCNNAETPNEAAEFIENFAIVS